MPYSDNSELPPAVREKYTEHCQTVFRHTFNEWDGDEATKFKVAHTAAGNCQRSTTKQEESLAMTDQSPLKGITEYGKELAQAMADGMKPNRDLAVKFTEGSDDTIEGIGIPFGGPLSGKDIQGESFTKSTDFCLDWFEKRPLLYDHALNGTIKTYKVGDVFAAEATDDGIFVKAELNKRGRYYNVVRKLIDQQALGFSSGAVPYLVQQDAQKNITRWPWFELSLTTTPANPDAVVYAVKASDALDHMEAANIDIPAPVEAALKAFDEWATEQTPETPGPEPYAEQTERVLAGLKAWVDQTEARVDFRAKSGRELSRANVESLREAFRIIGALLEKADKPSTDEAEANKAVAEHLLLEAELLGIAPG